jgi:hypothetical protein
LKQARCAPHIKAEGSGVVRHYGICVNTMTPGGTKITDRMTPRQFIAPGVMAEGGDVGEINTATIRTIVCFVAFASTF